MNLEFLSLPGRGGFAWYWRDLYGGSRPGPGWRASVVAALSCTLGIVPHMLAAITGLAALLHASPLAFETIRYLGVAYLLWMAWSTLQSHGALHIDPHKTPRSNGAVIFRASCSTC